MDFYVWTDDIRDPKLAWIDTVDVDGFEENAYHLADGDSVRAWFPEDAVCKLEKDHGTRLADSVPNTDKLLCVSRKLREILEPAIPLERVEYLPVRFKSPRGKLLTSDHCLVNLLGAIAAMDPGKSDFVGDTISKDRVLYFKRLVLDATRIPPDTSIFRLAGKPDVVLVREDLGKQILRAGCTGLGFMSLERYGSEFRG